MKQPHILCDTNDVPSRVHLPGDPVTVTSTGIGGASTVIAIEELMACGARVFIRIGSAGASQSDIGLGDLVIPTGAVREDGASRMYVRECFPAVPDLELAGGP